MLQLGLESGSPRTLDRLNKGIDLEQASAALKALAAVEIRVYLYVMFNTPGETEADAQKTLEFVVAHAPYISFLNTSILNLPIDYPVYAHLRREPFLGEGNLSLYTGFVDDNGWDRMAVRRFIQQHFSRQPEIAAINRRTPPIFGANHALFFNHLY